MLHYEDGISVEHTLGSFGYKIVRYAKNFYILYYLNGDYEIEYGVYDDLAITLECAEALLETVRNPS